MRTRSSSVQDPSNRIDGACGGLVLLMKRVVAVLWALSMGAGTPHVNKLLSEKHAYVSGSVLSCWQEFEKGL